MEKKLFNISLFYHIISSIVFYLPYWSWLEILYYLCYACAYYCHHQINNSSLLTLPFPVTWFCLCRCSFPALLYVWLRCGSRVWFEIFVIHTSCILIITFPFFKLKYGQDFYAKKSGKKWRKAFLLLIYYFSSDSIYTSLSHQLGWLLK